jgi:hypothetical protein
MLRVGIGLEARKVEATSREMKDRFGVLAYSLGALQALRTSEPARFRLALDGQPAECEAIACLVDNAGTIGIPGRHTRPKSRVTGSSRRLARTTYSWPLPAAGRQRRGRAGAEIAQHWRRVIDRDRSASPVQADGEMGHDSISIDVCGAVRVLTTIAAVNVAA